MRAAPTCLPVSLIGALAGDRGVDVVLWDATVPLPGDLAAAVEAAPVALLTLGDFANGGTPLAAGDGFATRLRTLDPGLVDTAGTGPVACASWGECAAALADAQQITYEGVTGRRS